MREVLGKLVNNSFDSMYDCRGVEVSRLMSYLSVFFYKVILCCVRFSLFICFVFTRYKA